MKSILFSIFLVFPPLAFSVTDCKPTPVPLMDRDFKGIEKFIVANQFTSIECLLAALPREVLGFRSYVTSSLSLQEASFENPRVLLGSPYGEAVFTFNGSPQQKGFDKVEFLAVNDLKTPTAWVPGEISLTNGQLAVNRESARCVKCHGQPVRPIWAQYSIWPHTFGSIDDWMPEDKKVYKGTEPFDQDYANGRLNDKRIAEAKKSRVDFLEYKKLATTHPRYSIVEAASDPANLIFPFSSEYRTRNIAYRPNLNMGSAMSLMQSKILYNRLMTSQLAKQFPNTLLYQAKCNIDDVERAKIEEILTAGVPDNTGKNILELAGILNHELTLEFLVDGSHNEGGYFGGNASLDPEGPLMRDYVYLHGLTEFLDPNYKNYYLSPPEIGPESQSIRSYYDSVFLDANYQIFVMYNAIQVDLHFPPEFNPETNKYIYPSLIELCRKIKIDVEAELAGSKFMVPVASEVVPQQAWPVALNSCIACHDSAPEVAPPIPFRDKQKLSLLGIENIAKRVEAITHPEKVGGHKGGNRMPLGRKALTEQERADILNWIRSK